MKLKLLVSLFIFPAIVFGQSGSIITHSEINETLQFAKEQVMSLYSEVQPLAKRLPRTINAQGKLVTSNDAWWTSGFFPGTLWYLYEYSGKTEVMQAALEMSERVRNQQYTTDNHDVGFMIFCSFGNALRLTDNKEFESVIINAARSLSTRFNPVTGTIKSWDNRRWQYPVIIDNMMNLELLTQATKISGDSSFYKIAVTHANTTMKHHFRPDGSSYHVLNYDTLKGGTLEKVTFQGFADESSWARGQAWGLYGYVMMYRETGIQSYLNHAIKIADYIAGHPNLPEDKIPYWDFNAPDIPNALRDASAGSVIASALIELSTFTGNDKSAQYLQLGERMLKSLASYPYLAAKGENGNFILKHSVGFMARNSEVDVPLTYADYYFVEALMRLKDLKSKTAQTPAKKQNQKERNFWIQSMIQIADPVLTNLSNNTLRASMPVETTSEGSSRGREKVSHLEALGRTVCGIAPWLELNADKSKEGRLREKYLQITLKALKNAVDSTSPDFMGFTVDRQNLVDAAFLAQGFLRAPAKLWCGLDKQTQELMIRSMLSTRQFKPLESNWLLFSATIEAFLYRFTGTCNFETIDYALKRFAEWYKGDSWYGDGAAFHFDYYNSLVIHPMLYDVLNAVKTASPEYQKWFDVQTVRLTRHADQLERMISPEGTYPAIGRSLVYRFGAFHALSQAALLNKLPEHLRPAQARSALTAVIQKQIAQKGTFDKKGWLTLGFAGHQPNLAESYISTGSLYLCSAVFLPLGLPATDEFWTTKPEAWTNKKAWKGEKVTIDKALKK
jgi:hypothetical protein